MTDSELLLACLEGSGLTKQEFCQDVLAGRSYQTLRRWLNGQPIPPEAREFLERYYKRLLNRDKGKRNFEAGLLKRETNVTS